MPWAIASPRVSDSSNLRQRAVAPLEEIVGDHARADQPAGKRDMMVEPTRPRMRPTMRPATRCEIRCATLVTMLAA
jgi:hypothetical protein